VNTDEPKIKVSANILILTHRVWPSCWCPSPMNSTQGCVCIQVDFKVEQGRWGKTGTSWVEAAHGVAGQDKVAQGKSDTRRGKVGWATS
jgi:hypothetical protein